MIGERVGYQRVMVSFSALLAVAALIAAGFAALAYGLWLPRLQRRQEELERLVDERTEQLQVANQAVAGAVLQDSVTGIANHRQFQDFLRSEWRRALRDASPVSLIMIDVDHFRDYNDEFGRDASDACLRQIAQTLSQGLRRPGDLVARYRTEAFGVVLGRTDREGASCVAHRLHGAVAALALPNPRAPGGGPLTISLGVATFTPALDSSWQELELIAAADRALEEAKDRGQNCVVVA